MFLIEEYDGRTSSELVKLQHVVLWARIHKIHDLYVNEAIVDQLTRWVGTMRSVEMNSARYLEGIMSGSKRVSK